MDIEENIPSAALEEAAASHVGRKASNEMPVTSAATVAMDIEPDSNTHKSVLTHFQNRAMTTANTPSEKIWAAIKAGKALDVICMFCGLTYSKSANMVRHCQRHHGGECKPFLHSLMNEMQNGVFCPCTCIAVPNANQRRPSWPKQNGNSYTHTHGLLFSDAFACATHVFEKHPDHWSCFTASNLLHSQLRCVVCTHKPGFKSVTDITQHVKKCHKVQEYTPAAVYVTFGCETLKGDAPKPPSTPILEQKTNHKRKQCDVCEEFITVGNFKRHYATHPAAYAIRYKQPQSNKQYKCEVCYLVYTTKHALKNHMATHQGKVHLRYSP